VHSQGPLRLTGIGRLHHGDRFLVEVAYTLAVVATPDGAPHAEGWLSAIEAPLDMFDLMNRRPHLTLHLADGRRWDFVMDTPGHGVTAGQGLRER
jgi:hypothetical protein